MDEKRYQIDPAYRKKIDGNRRGGQSRSRAKIEAARRNVAKSPGRPRKDGLASGWQSRGLSPIEAETEHRSAEAGRVALQKRQVMVDAGWTLEQEWAHLDRVLADGTAEADERKTEAWMLKEGGAAALGLYQEWRDLGGKGLVAEVLTDPPVPDYVLKLLCRHRLAELGRVADDLTGFAI